MGNGVRTITYRTKWSEDGPSLGEMHDRWNDLFDRFCAIDDMIEALKSDQTERDLVKDGPSWQEIQKQLTNLAIEKKEVDRRLYSLQMDITIFKGY
jgi:hypothetical protein